MLLRSVAPRAQSALLLLRIALTCRLRSSTWTAAFCCMLSPERCTALKVRKDGGRAEHQIPLFDVLNFLPVILCELRWDEEMVRIRYILTLVYTQRSDKYG